MINSLIKFYNVLVIFFSCVCIYICFNICVEIIEYVGDTFQDVDEVEDEFRNLILMELCLASENLKTIHNQYFLGNPYYSGMTSLDNAFLCESDYGLVLRKYLIKKKRYFYTFPKVKIFKKLWFHNTFDYKFNYYETENEVIKKKSRFKTRELCKTLIKNRKRKVRFYRELVDSTRINAIRNIGNVDSDTLNWLFMYDYEWRMDRSKDKYGNIYLASKIRQKRYRGFGEDSKEILHLLPEEYFNYKVNADINYDEKEYTDFLSKYAWLDKKYDFEAERRLAFEQEGLVKDICTDDYWSEKKLDKFNKRR